MPPPVYPPGSYPARVVADGASNYWRLNETSGTAAVDVIGGATGTISGGVTLAQPGALADGDKAMGFDGTTGKVETAANVAMPVVMSVECWINLKSGTPTSAFPSILSNRPGATTVVFDVHNARLELWGPGGIYANNDTNLPQGVWLHVVCVFTGTTATFFVNGSKDAAINVAFARPSPSLTPIRIGWDAEGGIFWPGSLDDVAIYPRALTAPEIAAHYALRTFSLTAWRGVPWWVQIQGDEALESFNLWEPITPSNTVNLPRGVTGGIWVGGGGDVAAVMGDNTMPVVIAAVPAGSWLPLAAKRIQATGTTATGLVALYEA